MRREEKKHKDEKKEKEKNANLQHFFADFILFELRTSLIILLSKYYFQKLFFKLINIHNCNHFRRDWRYFVQRDQGSVTVSIFEAVDKCVHERHFTRTTDA